MDRLLDVIRGFVQFPIQPGNPAQKVLCARSRRGTRAEAFHLLARTVIVARRETRHPDREMASRILRFGRDVVFEIWNCARDNATPHRYRSHGVVELGIMRIEHERALQRPARFYGQIHFERDHAKQEVDLRIVRRKITSQTNAPGRVAAE